MNLIGISADRTPAITAGVFALCAHICVILHRMLPFCRIFAENYYSI